MPYVRRWVEPNYQAIWREGYACAKGSHWRENPYNISSEINEHRTWNNGYESHCLKMRIRADIRERNPETKYLFFWCEL